MKRIIAAAMLATSLGACATVEPDPCTPEWVEYKTDKIMTSFAGDHRAVVRDLKSFSKRMENPGPFTMLRMKGMLDRFERLANDFQDTVIPELKSAAEQCGTPAEFVPAFTGFLRDEGVGEDVLKWIDAFGTIIIEDRAAG